MARARWAARTSPTSRCSTGTSCRVSAIIRFRTYGTRSRARAANRSEGWVVWRTAIAATSMATIRSTNVSPRATPSTQTVNGPSVAAGVQAAPQVTGAMACTTRIAAASGASTAIARARRPAMPAVAATTTPAAAMPREGDRVEGDEREGDDGQEPGELGDRAQPVQPRPARGIAQGRRRGGAQGHEVAPTRRRARSRRAARRRPRRCRARPTGASGPSSRSASRVTWGGRRPARVMTPASAKTARGLSSAIGRPPSMTTTRSATSASRRMSWVMHTIAVPPSRSSRTRRVTRSAVAVVLRHRGLVEHQERRAHRHGGRDRHQLPLRPAQVVGVLAEDVAEAEPIRRLGHAGRDRVGRRGPGSAARTRARRGPVDANSWWFGCWAT